MSKSLSLISRLAIRRSSRAMGPMHQSTKSRTSRTSSVSLRRRSFSRAAPEGYVESGRRSVSRHASSEGVSVLEKVDVVVRAMRMSGRVGIGVSFDDAVVVSDCVVEGWIGMILSTTSSP